MPAQSEKRCGFCGRPRNEVRHLIGGLNGCHICNACVTASAGVIDKAEKKALLKKSSNSLKRPREIVVTLDEAVIGQNRAKRDLAVAVYEHYRRREVSDLLDGGILLDQEVVEVEKSNVLLLGPSGSGKTILAKTIARMLDVPFYLADATRLTQAGYVGDDVESLLTGLVSDADGDIERAQWGIVFLDEFDKLARKTGRQTSGQRDVSGEGVQQSLLRMLEGSKVQLSKPKSKDSVKEEIDTTNILFICAGAFVGVEQIVDRRLNRHGKIGFTSDNSPVVDKEYLSEQVSEEDLEEYGFIPEIVGRLPVRTTTHALTESELVSVLVKPRNAICKQFRAMYSLDDIDLQFDPPALIAIAQAAMKQATGARALRSIVKQVLAPYSYESPASDIVSIRITQEAVENPGSAVITRTGDVKEKQVKSRV